MATKYNNLPSKLHNSLIGLNDSQISLALAGLYNDDTFQNCLIILGHIFAGLYEDENCKYISHITETLYEQYCNDLDSKIKMEKLLIEYKNKSIDETSAYKKYTNIKEKMLNENIKNMNKYKRFDELLKLYNDKQGIFDLVSKYMRVLNLDERNIEDKKFALL